jgi:hypothetical protein
LLTGKIRFFRKLSVACDTFASTKIRIFGLSSVFI